MNLNDNFDILNTNDDPFVRISTNEKNNIVQLVVDYQQPVIQALRVMTGRHRHMSARDANEVLKSADFFDAAQYGQVTFKSTGIKRIKGNVYAVTGDLTLHGVTKPVTLELTYNGTTTNPFNKKTIAGFKVTGAIKRSDFNLGAGFPAPTLADVAHLDANVILNAN